MNPETILYRQKYDWDVAKQVFQYAEKYYGMDELYFYDAPPASSAIPHPKTIEIWTRQEFVTFWEQLFRDDEYIAKYVDPIPDDTGRILMYVLCFIDWALIRMEREAIYNSLDDYFSENPSEYYNLHMRKELLELYIFCQETPYKKQKSNEIILTINKGLQKSQRKIVLPNFDNWMLRSALLNYCQEHLIDIHSIEEAKAELKALKKGGRSLADPNVYRIIYGTFTMFKEAAKDTKAISPRLCRLINNYLVYLGLITEESAMDEIKMRALISYILSKKEKPRFPSCKITDKNWDAFMRRLQQPLNTFDDLL